jgi:hypothetical protein
MKYVFRIILYYPLLLTICLFFESIIGLFLLIDIIWNLKITQHDTLKLFKIYFMLYKFEYYINNIKGTNRLFIIDFH